MSQSVAADRLDVPLRNAKAALRAGEGAVQKVKSDPGAVLEAARARAQLEPKAMADDMDISHSLVLRGMKDGQLSFHRLWDLPDAYWRELVVVVVQARGLGEVDTTVRIRRSA